MSQSIIPIISHLLPHGVLNILTNYNPALTILVLIVLTITTTTLVSILYQAHFSPLSKIPGPFLAKYSRLWLAYHGFKGDFHTLLVELHETYGDLVRIGPDELSVADVEAVRKIYGIGSKFEKSAWYTVSHGTRKFDLFGERSEDVHRVQRRIVNNVYSIAALKELEPYVDSAIGHFMGIMRQKQGRSLDLGVWVQLLAFDIIGEVTFSQRFGLMDIGEETDTLKEMKRAQKSVSWVSQIPYIYRIHEFLHPVIGNQMAATARNGSLRQFTLKHVEARKARGSDHKDLLDKLFEIHDAKPEQFEAADVVSMAATNVVAGSDTTATALKAIIYYLLKNPEYKQRLVDEVDSFFAPADEAICQFDVANRMPYLQAVMYEAMRLHPVVGQTLPRVVPHEGLQCGSHFIPAQTVVGTSPFVMSRSTAVFGQDAHVFRPERWLGDNKGEMQRFWLPFGAGSRTCIGKNLSWIEMSKFLPTLFRHFELQLTDPNAEWEVKSYFFAIQTGLNVILRPRKGQM